MLKGYESHFDQTDPSLPIWYVRDRRAAGKILNHYLDRSDERSLGFEYGPGRNLSYLWKIDTSIRLWLACDPDLKSLNTCASDYSGLLQEDNQSIPAGVQIIYLCATGFIKPAVKTFVVRNLDPRMCDVPDYRTLKRGQGVAVINDGNYGYDQGEK